MSERVTPALLGKWKSEGHRITALTAYDYPLACVLDSAGIDVVLVGDSVGTAVLGLPDTVGVTMDAMIHHSRAVARGVTRALLVGDMPFLSYHLSASQALENAARFLQEGGCQAVKLEGFYPQLVETLVDVGIPVMGHLGLLPQRVRLTGSYRVAGRSADERTTLFEQAQALERAGCFAMVLECVIPEPAGEITRALAIPTIGIGSGPHCDGQILVTHDMLGLNRGRVPRFVRRYADLDETIRRAVGAYADDVREGRFPVSHETYSEE
ncbi:3-methyl-2-oxobutanoate hydroxymethyltransferase [Candidatus Fermentibacteria bacterium]|nr:3-methyl-2-oxobutanoate hydroxymethyltransferase [Candidatus Fermentibacteria bacterium]